MSVRGGKRASGSRNRTGGARKVGGRSRRTSGRGGWLRVGRLIGQALIVGLVIGLGIVVGAVLRDRNGEIGDGRAVSVEIEAGEEPSGDVGAVPVPADVPPLPPSAASDSGTSGVAVASLSAPPPPRPPAASVPPSPGGPLWLRNAVPFALPVERPMIVLVFDDLGLDRRRTERVIALPGPLTLSFLPYAGDLARQTRAGHVAGHELLVHMPMEPLAAHLDPGPGALLTTLSPDEIARRLEHSLAAFDGYVGINNHMGSRFTGDREHMLPVLTELQRRGLLFLDSVTVGNTVGPALAEALHLPHARRHVFLDDSPTPAAVRASLVRVEQVARQTGTAIAIGHPHDVTLEAVSAWLPGLAAKGFVLAPLSAAVRANGSAVHTPPEGRK